jgi:hypothetical protein
LSLAFLPLFPNLLLVLSIVYPGLSFYVFLLVSQNLQTGIRSTSIPHIQPQPPATLLGILPDYPTTSYDTFTHAALEQPQQHGSALLCPLWVAIEFSLLCPSFLQLAPRTRRHHHLLRAIRRLSNPTPASRAQTGVHFPHKTTNIPVPSHRHSRPTMP